MNNSELIVHSTNQSIYCCCYYLEVSLCSATPRGLTLWDCLSGFMIAKFDFEQQLAPVSVKLLKIEQKSAVFLLQDKSGLVLIIKYTPQTKKFQIQRSYSIENIGFTKLPIQLYGYTGQEQLNKQITDKFQTICYKNIIERRELYTGILKQRFLMQNDDEFSDVTCMVRFRVLNKDYLMVAQQGGMLKKIEIPSSGSSQQIQIPNQKCEKLAIDTKEQIKIILCIEPMNYYKAAISIRNDRVIILSLQNMQVKCLINLNYIRLVKEISKQGNYLAFTGKNRVGITKDGAILKNQKINTELIVDIDVCEYGILGVSQQGKIFFLPI